MDAFSIPLILFIANYAQQLAQVMNKMLNISQVASLAREIEKKSWVPRKIQPSEVLSGDIQDKLHPTDERLSYLFASSGKEDNKDDCSEIFLSSAKSMKTEDEMQNVVDLDDIDPYTGSLSSDQKRRISTLLGQWEEPSRGLTQNVCKLIFPQFFMELCSLNLLFLFFAGRCNCYCCIAVSPSACSHGHRVPFFGSFWTCRYS